MMGGKKKKSRKQRGGMGYGFGGSIGTAGPLWNSSWGGEVTKAGTPVYDTADPQRGSGRRRTRGGERVEVLTVKAENVTDEAAVQRYRAVGATDVMEREDAESKGYYIIGPAPTGASRRRHKKSKKAKKGKSRRRTMRGGAGWQSVAPVGYGYTGTGARGLADATAYASKVPASGGPSQNADGAYHV